MGERGDPVGQRGDARVGAVKHANEADLIDPGDERIDAAPANSITRFWRWIDPANFARIEGCKLSVPMKVYIARRVTPDSMRRGVIFRDLIVLLSTRQSRLRAA